VISWSQHAVLPSTSYDVEVDQASNNPGYQAFEKLTAELYLGEIVHKIVQSLVHHSVLFNGVSAPMLDMPGGIITQSMAMIEGGNSIQEVKQAIVDVLEINSVDDVPDEDAAIVRKVCEIVGTRAARLYACAIAAVLVQTGHAQLGGGYSGGYDKLLMAAEGK
jgi:hexokinase